MRAAFGSARSRAVARSVAALAMASAGLLSAWFADRAFTDTDPGSAVGWVRGCLAGGVLALLLLVAANLTAASDGHSGRLLKLGQAVVVVTLLGLVVGWLVVVADGLDPLTATSIGFVVALYPLSAVILGLESRGLAR